MAFFADAAAETVRFEVTGATYCEEDSSTGAARSLGSLDPTLKLKKKRPKGAKLFVAYVCEVTLMGGGSAMPGTLHAAPRPAQTWRTLRRYSSVCARSAS